MFTMCFVIIYDLDEKKRRIDATRAMLAFAKNEENIPDTILKINIWPGSTMQEFKYDLSNIDGVYTEVAHDSKVMFRFNPPNHDIIVDALVGEELEFFLKHFFFIYERRNQEIRLNNNFHTPFSEYMTVDCYIKNEADFGNLSMLVLENCIISSLDEQIKNSPVSYLSLTGSTLGTTQIEKDTFWNWMTIDIICESLEVLEMNSNKLSVLPFEIKYLTNIQTLSVANNDLTRLPYCIGELKKLKQLFINNNKLRYLPGCLHDIIFKAINVSDNAFEDEFNELNSNDIFISPASPNRIESPNPDITVINNLSLICLQSLVKNPIKFKRQDIPHTLWYFFDEFIRCELCHKYVIPDNCMERYSCAYAMSYNFNKNIKIMWKFFECRVRCYKQFVFNLYDDVDN